MVATLEKQVVVAAVIHAARLLGALRLAGRVLLLE